MSDDDPGLFDCSEATAYGTHIGHELGGPLGAEIPIIAAIVEAGSGVAAPAVPETLGLASTGYTFGSAAGPYIGGAVADAGCQAVDGAITAGHLIHDYLAPPDAAPPAPIGDLSSGWYDSTTVPSTPQSPSMESATPDGSPWTAGVTDEAEGTAGTLAEAPAAGQVQSPWTEEASEAATGSEADADSNPGGLELAAEADWGDGAEAGTFDGTAVEADQPAGEASVASDSDAADPGTDAGGDTAA